ncbi:TOMM precursor leader peptide-binding protein [Bacillus haynesii]|uniref:TOMM precursor leader peptide-binding protein n=1 Tax=Bacillus haynesii TaxID=1925021 RepID=UPI00227DA1CF|nr:TOMM precursor leader peptide-binding protein [Bacillus haynesii]MCY8540862.1 TOMM precursor leader peptide-binding protein [Bacillus haynesii]MEC1358956.1 TOMM precursor leader peptide-binding protein [Bacillus haynesii]MEC1451756.1 TOMM precursor leader peptide-binding protein [Bacillus haynesii]
MKRCILVVGEGLMAEGASQQLSAEYNVIRRSDFESRIPAETSFVLVLHDAWRPLLYREAEKVLRAAGIPWLRGFASFGEGVIGPLVYPSESGCSKCADMRRYVSGPDSIETLELEQKSNDINRDPWASKTGCRQMVSLICTEVDTIMNGGRGRLEKKLYIVNLKTLESSLHAFIPEPTCPICGSLPEDGPESARISLRPSLKTNPDSFRVRNTDDLKQTLSKDYLDQRTGIFNAKIYDAILPFADMIVNMPLWMGNEGVGGRSHSYEDSELTAILEGLERYSGIEPRGKRTIVHDTYENVKDRALDPAKVGLHQAEKYTHPDFPFQPFHPARPLRWVWGYSFLQKRPILVPESLAYYSLGREDSFVYETSNGCALGGSLEEAIFHGILEAAERDSFLLAWYTRLPLRQLDLDSSGDLELRLMTERVRSVAGYDLHVFNSTMEYGIPSIWAIAKNRKREGLNLICSAGAHPDPVKAVKSALHELAGMMLKHDRKFESERSKYQQMLRSPALVREMEDHSFMYGLPEAEERLRFLLNQSRPLQTFDDAFKKRKKYLDLTEDLCDLLEAFRSLNLEVIVVDQTSPVIKRNGLYCVKVLIPGLIPMTFGQRFIRLEGLERIFTVPKKLGFAEEPLRPEQLNLHPHPFP